MPRSVGQVPNVYNYKHSQYSRQFATNETGCLWPFGFGLSYSSFKYSAPVLNDYSVLISVTNEGPFDGAEVVQLYIRDEYASVTRPVKELKAFRKVFLQPGETKQVSLTIDHSALSFYDDQTGQWTAEPGDFKALIGTSSRNIISDYKFILKE